MVHYCKRPITKLNDYTPDLPHLDYRTFPHLVRMFKGNLFKEYQEYWSKSLNKDKFDSSVGNKLSLYNAVENEVTFQSYLDLIKNVKTRVVLSPNDEEVASCKKIPNSRLECTNHTLFQTKMVEIVTLFQTKTAKKPYLLASHIPI